MTPLIRRWRGAALWRGCWRWASDAVQWFKPLRKNLGKKNCELSDEDIHRV